MRIDDAFVWEVPEQDLRWVGGESDPRPGDVSPAPTQRWLIADWRGRARFRVYQPLRDTPGLFLDFAAIRQPPLAENSAPEGTLEIAAAEFASRYGPLGDRQQVVISVQDTQAVNPDARVGATVRGESFPKWRGAVTQVSWAVELWRATSHRDANAVAELLKNSPEYPRRDLEGGRSALRSIVANGLQEHSAYLTCSDTPSTGTFEIALIPQTLLGAIWLQLASAIERNIDFRRCDVCSSWFEIAPNARRKDQRYCSTACRSRALRQRKETALQLRNEGQGIEAIANEVGSDERTVARWLGSGGLAER